MIAFSRRVLSTASLMLLASTAGWAQSADFDSKHWAIETGTPRPSYAATEPVSSDLNIDAVVLGCEPLGARGVLQLQVYTKDDGPLRPTRATSVSLRDDPRAEIAVDGRVFPVTLIFADNYAVLTDAQEGALPQLSNRLLSAMQSGKTMKLRFDLASGEPRFDAEAVIDLQASGAQDAIATLRHCGGAAPGLAMSSAGSAH